MAFCDEKRCGVAFPEISYGFYQVYADLYGVDAKRISLKEDFSICVEDYCGNDRTVVIANPNAPTGIALSREQVERIVASNPDHVVLIDEAYVDFGGESALELVKRYDNLLVVRIFSKSYSLAGARLGFAIGHPDLIADLEKIKYSTNPYNINRLTMLLGEKTVEADPYYQEKCAAIIDTRCWAAKELEGLGFEVLPSEANFLFARHPKADGARIYSELKKRGILVRHFTKERIKDFNRITIGTPAEMEQLISTIKEILL
jgi:histidinol-phosphate aminotransferase